MKKLLFVVLFCQAAFGGDWYAIGLRAGVPLTDAFDTVVSGGINLKSATKRFTIGPSAELVLPFGFGVEVDALYKRTTVEFSGDDKTGEQTTGSWEFPLLAKFRLPGAGLRPYLAGGVSFRHFGDLVAFATGPDRSTSGIVFGGGLEIKIKRLRISPEIRYTHWDSGRSGNTTGPLSYNQNQVDFLMGFTF